MAKDFYKTLGVDKSASQDDIKKAFRALAHKHHPDKGGSDATFKEITEAYAVLGDEKKRREYDAYGQYGGQPGAGGAGGNPFGGFDFSQFQQGFGQGGVEFDFGDIFGDMFGGQGRGGRAARGHDISIDLEISFKESIFGVERTVRLSRVRPCTTCSGTGAKPGTVQDSCKTCSGKGRVQEVRNSPFGQFASTRTCSACEGAGTIPKEKCSECRGAGVKRREEELTIAVPAGINSGETLRLTREGEAVKNSTAGDLYARIHVQPHKTFTREGHNLIMDLPVALTDALLGTEVSVLSLDGTTLEVKIPVMKRVTEHLRIRGKGVPTSGSSRGDLIIRLEVTLPHKLSAKAKKLIEELKSEGV